MRNLKFTLAYDGTDFHGWQRQPDAPTVQCCLETALERVVGEPVRIVASGRTDAGVHALNQVANLRTSNPIPCPNLVTAVNDLLPPTIRVQEAEDVPDGFHARYASRSKTYRYRILQALVCSPFVARFVYHYPYPLDRTRMAEAARLIEGRYDFASFAGSGGSVVRVVREPPLPPGTSEEFDREGGEASTEGLGPDSQLPVLDSRSMVRTVFRSRIIWLPKTSILAYEVSGSGFLHHMVRNIVGTLIEVGRSKLEPCDMLRILEARDRRRAGPTAPAQGLCLMKVEY
jgi:tRNA pseudouridine38-40 synthase